LIEVMLALAIIAIGLIAIIGLLPSGVQASRNAADNTVAATIIQDVFSTIRATPFAIVDLSGFRFAPAGPYDLGAYNGAPVAYFDQSGFSVVLVGPNANPEDSYFRVDIAFAPQPPVPAVLSEITATVSWPAKPNLPLSANANTTIFLTRVAQYE
jgi:type II secretory pathway pseudopilin PulG